MEKTNQSRIDRKVGFWQAFGRMACIGGIVFIGGCSTMEDIGDSTTEGLSSIGNALNPANWFGDNETAPEAKQEQAQASTTPKSGGESAPPETVAQRRDAEREKEKYPKLSSVPERPKQSTSQRAKDDRKALRDGLAADTQNAQYSDKVLRGQPAAPPPAAPVLQPDASRSNDRVATAPRGALLAPAPAAANSTPTVAPTVSAPTLPRPGIPQATRQARAMPAPTPAPVVPSAPSAAANTPPTPPSVRAPTRVARLQAPARTASRQAGPRSPRGVLKTVQVATIYFRDGSARLSDSDRRVIRQVAAVVRQKGGLLRIIGHSSVGGPAADPSWREHVNYKVSLDRANAVASELLRLGLPSNHLKVGAEGDRSPIYAESSATGAAGNRRTEIYMEYVDGG